jgi:hypothetical protein
MKAKMENEPPEDSIAQTTSTETDWEARTLCSDGNCIGVIGPDGRCKECGLPYDGAAIEGQSFEADDYDDDDHDEEDEMIAEADTPDDPDWENRQLCSDGNCIGVIGPDGRCKECGKRFKG